MANNIGSLAVQITGSTTGLTASLNDANKQISSFKNSTSSNDFKGMNLKIGDNLKTQIDPLKSSMKSLIGMAGEFGAALALAAATGAKSLIKESVKLAAEMETTKVSFEVLLGDKGKADDLFKELQSLSARTPLTQSGVNDAAKALLGSGQKQSNVAPMVEMLGNFASDKASVKDLAVLMGQVKGKGQLYAEEAQQFADKNIMVYDLLGKTFKKTDTEMRAMVADGKVSAPMLTRALHEATQAGGQFHGMMDKQGQTFTGLQSTLEDTFKQAGAKFGQIIIEELDLKGVMKDITGMFEDGTGDNSSLRKFVHEFKPVVNDFVYAGKVLIDSGKWLMEFITPALKFANDLKDAINKFGWYVNDLVMSIPGMRVPAGPEDHTGAGDFSGDKGGAFIDELKNALDYGAEQLSSKQLDAAKEIRNQYDPRLALQDRADELTKMRDLGAFKERPDMFAFAMGKLFEPTLKEFDANNAKMGVNASKGSVEAASIISQSLQRDRAGDVEARMVAAAEQSKWIQEQIREHMRVVADAVTKTNLIGVK